MKKITRKNHIFLSYSLLFVPYFFCIAYFAYSYQENYFKIFLDFYVLVYFMHFPAILNEIYYAVGLHNYFYIEPKYYPLFFYSFLWLYSSYKITHNYWKNDTIINTFLLYFINSFLFSPLLVYLVYKISDWM